MGYKVDLQGSNMETTKTNKKNYQDKHEAD